jgi:hypothetical protein
LIIHHPQHIIRLHARRPRGAITEHILHDEAEPPPVA